MVSALAHHWVIMLILKTYRVSFTNSARIYNAEHSDAIARFPTGWSVQPSLTTVAVSDTFYIYALLRGCRERGTYLTVDSEGTQSERLDPLLMARTRSMVGPAREGWNHVCHKCCAVKTINGVHRTCSTL